MNATRWLLGVSTSCALAAALAAGCSSSSSNNPPADSGAGDVTTEAGPVEAAAETGPVEAAPPADAACVPDASIETIPVPDASIGDSGANTAACLTCFKSACASAITTCDKDCTCVSAYETFTTCVAAPGASLQNCATALATAIPGGNIATLTCAFGCAAACGVNITPPGDGGPKDGATSDGATTGDAAGE